MYQELKPLELTGQLTNILSLLMVMADHAHHQVNQLIMEIIPLHQAVLELDIMLQVFLEHQVQEEP